MVPTPVLFAETPGDNAHDELRDHNPLPSRSTVPLTATLPTQGQAGCSGEGDPTRAPGRLLQDPSKAGQDVAEGQVSSSTDPVKSPMKDPTMASLGGAHAGETNANLCRPNKAL